MRGPVERCAAATVPTTTVAPSTTPLATGIGSSSVIVPSLMPSRTATARGLPSSPSR